MVTLWWASPRQARPWHADLLTPAERRRAEAFRRDEDRDRFTTANALLRLAAEDFLGTAPVVDRTCPRCGEPHGKPRVQGVEVSVSHSGDLIAVALTDLGPVGVDVEETKRHTDIDSLLRYVFSAAELAAIPDPAVLFYQAWTRKESVLKATGDGLSVPMTTLTVLPSSAEYNIRDLTPRLPGYAAALTVLTPDPSTPFAVNERDGSILLRASPHHR